MEAIAGHTANDFRFPRRTGGALHNRLRTLFVFIAFLWLRVSKVQLEEAINGVESPEITTSSIAPMKTPSKKNAQIGAGTG